MLIEPRSRSEIELALFAAAVELQRGDAIRAVVAEFYSMLKETPVARRISIRRQAHYLILIGVEVKTQVESYERI